MIGKRVLRLWHNRWGAEAYGAGLALMSFAATISIIASYDGKTFPEWPAHITINALIGIFTVLIKAGLGLLLSEDDFDDASRGALGSTLFLFKIWKWDAVNNIAKFAAFLTILVAVVDPFSQQIVGIAACTRESDALIASVGRTNSYLTTGGHTGPLDSEIDSPMAVAINTGLVGPPDYIPSLVSTTCTSGNCTFGRFSSVAVCHSCAEITPQIRNSGGATGPWNFTLAGNKSASFPDLDLVPSTYLNTSASLSPTHLLDVRILSLNATTYRSASAFQCQLFPCVRTYDALVSKGVLEERIISKVPMGFDAFGGVGRYVLAASNLTQQGERTLNCSARAANDTAGLVRVALPNVDAAPQEMHGSGSKAPSAWFPQECVWTFGSSPYLAIRPEIRGYLDGADIQEYDTTYIGTIVAKNLWRNETIDFNSVDWYMRNVSDVMTARIRNSSPNGIDDFAMGRTTLDTICVQVRWAWLSYPAALIACGFAFFLVLFVQTPREAAAMRSWKSSNLAILFCSLDEAIRERTELTWFRDEIDDVARTAFVQLAHDGAGKAKFSEDELVINQNESRSREDGFTASSW
ncbi:hypothetical protein ONZ43_g7835 [Nemania bipapillata]|uniref:Uncharacterized protein n=1 Tax=Nemania bipapillata TaxID=110536 RepID=A0ACC2HN17_9PEZI|nr:hypothetical protein ONZ43_g7835 [Nemania bipapillata]